MSNCLHIRCEPYADCQLDDEPGMLAELDQVIAETQQDLDRLVDTVEQWLPERGAARSYNQMVTGLLAQPAWDRFNLVTVLGLAVVRLAERRTEKAGSP